MWKFALGNLCSRPVRSVLALLGLTVAIAGMVGLFSVAQGLDSLVASTFQRIPGLIAMQPGAPIPLFSRLPAEWRDDLAEVPEVAAVNSEVWQRANVIDGQTIISPPRFLYGTDVAVTARLRHSVYRSNLTAGRFLMPRDRGTPHAVISRRIAEEFHKGVGDPLQVNGADLEIVGIYHCGSLLLDVAIVLDIETVRRITRFDSDSVSAFYIEPERGVDPQMLASRIRVAMRERTAGETKGPFPRVSSDAASNMSEQATGAVQSLLHLLNGQGSFPREAAEPRGRKNGEGDERTDPEGSGARSSPAQAALEIRTADQMGAEVRRFAQDLDVFLLIITSIGVLVAVLSIVNTMLMSVSERIIEFGILKANGWSKIDVLKLITYESAWLGVGGGLLGAAAGWAGTHLVNWLWPTRVYLLAGADLLLFAVIFSTALGVMGGLYPALWAMRLAPMEAIRRG